jgi:5-methylcytosine-specific restriction endonuclease McrA
MSERNRDKYGRPFDEATKRAVWQKGQTVQGYDATQYRKDACSAWMEYKEHGNVNTDRGWEIDHIYPKSAGGSDELANLQPLHWKNNRSKGDSTGQWQCEVS